MRAALYFDLDEHQDQEAHRLCIHGKYWWLVAWGMDEYLRKALDKEPPQIARDALEDARTELFALINEYDLSIEDGS